MHKAQFHGITLLMKPGDRVAWGIFHFLTLISIISAAEPRSKYYFSLPAFSGLSLAFVGLRLAEGKSLAVRVLGLGWSICAFALLLSAGIAMPSFVGRLKIMPILMGIPILLILMPRAFLWIAGSNATERAYMITGYLICLFAFGLFGFALSGGRLDAVVTTFMYILCLSAGAGALTLLLAIIPVICVMASRGFHL